MTEAGDRFPWSRMMHLGLGVLQLSPQAFWAATPREIAAAFPPQPRHAVPSRAEFDTLMTRFPDET